MSLGRVRARLYSDRHETLHVCSRELILLFGIQRYHVLGSSRCWALFGAVVSGSGPLYLDRHETLHVYVTGIVIIVWDTTVSCSRVVVVVGPCSGPLCRVRARPCSLCPGNVLERRGACACPLACWQGIVPKSTKHLRPFTKITSRVPDTWPGNKASS